MKSEPAEIAVHSDDWNILNGQIDHSILKGIRYVQGPTLSINPRVGEIKLETILDRSIVRKLDELGFIDCAFSVAARGR